MTWPEKPWLKLVAVDAESGEPRGFDSGSGVRLVDALAASCAVPGLWPPVTIEGRRYVDGAVRSNTSADYAAGAARVLVLAPLGHFELFPCETSLAVAIGDLRTGGAAVAYVEPDADSLAAIGANPADPATRRPTGEAGRQGRRTARDWR
ncbi:patatin-like phospholipase family protein [Amycolatopsis sp. NPDC051373]|uniref:patatin-like phospholipase family protein n=1 Tax=Amycolatopsis sp. NPDC051373 TaxID=3155801 RepID=UPI00344E003C